MNIHPLCNLLPPMSEAELSRLRESIRARGVKRPVVVLDGMILDGRHRWMIAKELGVKCPTRPYDAITDGASPADFVADEQNRRDMTPSQRAAFAADLVPFYEAEAAERKRRGGTPLNDSKGRACGHAAKRMGASESQVSKAKAIKETAPEAFEKIKKGESTVGAEHKKLRAPPRPLSMPEPKKAVLDANGKPVPDEMAELFGDPTLKDISNLIDDARKRVKIAAESRIGFWLDFEVINNALKEAKRAVIHNGAPYAVCPYQPNCRDGCKMCQKIGWLPESRYKLVPEEIRK